MLKILLIILTILIFFDCTYKINKPNSKNKITSKNKNKIYEWDSDKIETNNNYDSMTLRFEKILKFNVIQDPNIFKEKFSISYILAIIKIYHTLKPQKKIIDTFNIIYLDTFKQFSTKEYFNDLFINN